jgi:hypothetical protein
MARPRYPDLPGPYAAVSFASTDFPVRNRVFHCFRDLPFELRSMIWRFAFPERATIFLPTFRFQNNLSIRVIPPLLHTCSESRNEYFQAQIPDGEPDRENVPVSSAVKLYSGKRVIFIWPFYDSIAANAFGM